MGGLAALAREAGHKVTGCDAGVYPPMSDQLKALGIELMQGFGVEQMQLKPDLYVIGNVVSRSRLHSGEPKFALMEAILESGAPYTSGPQWLSEHVLQGRHVLAVAGTHGKTSTTSMLAWILEAAGLEPGFLVGGVPLNFGVSARLGKVAAGHTRNYFVIEADEYDTAFFDKRSKFLHYLPECAIVNNVEFDHADIFNDLDEIILSFQRMTLQVPRNGLVLVNGDCANCLQVKAKCPAPTQTVGVGPDCDIHIAITQAKAESTEFTLNGEFFTLPMIGEFNVRNAAMAVCAARFGGLTDDEIRAGLLTFKGVKRRQTERGEKNGITIIDDFGHHPTAIRVTLQGLRQRYPDRRLWAVFEPRSNTSRRKVLQEELVNALKEADGSIIAAINAIEKVPVELRLDPHQVAADVTASGRECYYEPNTDAIIARLKERAKSGDVIIVFSNGGFDGMHEKLLAQL